MKISPLKLNSNINYIKSNKINFNSSLSVQFVESSSLNIIGNYNKAIVFQGKKIIRSKHKESDDYHKRKDALRQFLLEKNSTIPDIKKRIDKTFNSITRANLGFVEDLAYNYNAPFNVLGMTLKYHSNFDNKSQRKFENLARNLCQKQNFQNPAETFANIYSNLNRNNINLASRFFSVEGLDFHSENIKQILETLKEENFNLIEALAKSKEFNAKASHLPNILRYTNQDNISLAIRLCTDKKLNFDSSQIAPILANAKKENIQEIIDLCEDDEIPNSAIAIIIDKNYETSKEEIRQLQRTLPLVEVEKMSETELYHSIKMLPFYKKENLDEVPLKGRRSVLKFLTKISLPLKLSSDFPLAPNSETEYSSLISKLAKSIGIKTKPVSPQEEQLFFRNILDLEQTLAQLSDDDFNNLFISQEYSKENFIKDVYLTVQNLPDNERQKVYNYFGFKLHKNPNGVNLQPYTRYNYSITGYPFDFDDDEKLKQITNPLTQKAIEELKPLIRKFNENNPIISNNTKITAYLNNILLILPELRTTIGKTQHRTHDFDIMKHSLKVLQKIAQNPEFDLLKEEDKKIMRLLALMHDITKSEGKTDSSHATESAFDLYFICKKFNLSKEEEIKLYTLAKNHNWLALTNNKNFSDKEKTKQQQSIAFDLQQDNLFEMAKMFTQADLKAVKKNDSFWIKQKESLSLNAQQIENFISELKTTQPLLPVTKFPKASEISKTITTINPDGSTNIKGLYAINGNIVIKFNEVESWEELGFPTGTVSKGYKDENGEFDTGNIHFFVHGLEHPNQLSKFDTFALPNSDVLLSVSYAERPESKFRFFRTQGVILNTNSEYIYGGGQSDSGSGVKKNISTFKNNYIFKGYRQGDRSYISDLIKEALNLSDEEYIQFIQKNKNKSMLEIEPIELQEKLIKAFGTINSKTRSFDRAYNEMFISNPEVMGVFAYSNHLNSLQAFYSKHNEFLRKYAKDNDLPFVVFGN